MARWCHSPRVMILPSVKVSEMLPSIVERRSSCSSGRKLGEHDFTISLLEHTDYGYKSA